jgi:hypothetical protein
MCLYLEQVEFDTEASDCLFPDSMWDWEMLEPDYLDKDRPFVDINECLEKYESKEGYQMKLK